MSKSKSKSNILLILSCLLLGAMAVPRLRAEEPVPVKKLILPGESFLVEGRPAFILLPNEAKRMKPQPWVFYAPTLEGLPVTSATSKVALPFHEMPRSAAVPPCCVMSDGVLPTTVTPP